VKRTCGGISEGYGLVLLGLEQGRRGENKNVKEEEEEEEKEIWQWKTSVS